MEIISNAVEFVGILALAVWLVAPSARVVWARVKPRRDRGLHRIELPPELFRDER